MVRKYVCCKLIRHKIFGKIRGSEKFCEKSFYDKSRSLQNLGSDNAEAN